VPSLQYPVKERAKGKALDRILPKTKEFCNGYVQCQSCDKIFRKGIYFMNMEKIVRQRLEQTEF
jgi:uncharacterized protein with PIN domain